MALSRLGLPILLACALLAGCAQQPTTPRDPPSGGADGSTAGATWLTSLVIEGEHRINVDWGAIGGGAEVIQFESKQSDPSKPITGHLYLEYGSDAVANVCASLHVGSSGSEVSASGDRPAYRSTLTPSEGPQVMAAAGGLALGTAPTDEHEPPVLVGFDQVSDPRVASVGKFWFSSEAQFSLRPTWRGNMTCIHSFADFTTGDYTETSLGLTGENLAESWSERSSQVLWLVYRSYLDYEVAIQTSAATWNEKKDIDGTGPEKSHLFLLQDPEVTLRVPAFRGDGSAFFRAVHLDIPNEFVPYLQRSGSYAPLPD